MKKNICFITDSVFDMGGIQRVVTNLTNELSDIYDITIICLHDIKEKNKIDYGLNKKIKIVGIYNSFFKELAIIPFKILRKINRKYKIIKNNSYFFDLIEDRVPYVNRKGIIDYCKKNKFDNIICTGINNCITMSMIKNKINQNVIGWWHHCYEGYVESGNYSVKRIGESLINLNQTIVLCENDAKLIKKKFNIDTVVMYNPIKVEKKLKIRKKEEKYFISVGRYHNIKRFDLLIKAYNEFYKKNKNWKLLIVGDGPERQHLQKLIDDLGLEKNIMLTGKTSNVDMYYEKSSVYLMTSKLEGFPTVILEAMNHALPIIAFYLPVFDEMLTADNSFVIQQENINEFVKKMHLIADNSTIREKMSDASFENVKKFDIENIKNKWKEILG